jgi:hypothetical protein
MEKYLPSYEELDRIFDYNKETGIFTRKVSTARCTKVGDIAGHINSQGYVIIKYLGEAYKAHRLAWLLTYKDWPLGDIDHIDGNKSNNAIKNLRDVSRSKNSLNTKETSSNKSGYKGVSLHNGKWRARIMVEGKQTIIGSYDTPEEASLAYIQYKKNIT